MRAQNREGVLLSWVVVELGLAGGSLVGAESIEGGTAAAWSLFGWVCTSPSLFLFVGIGVACVELPRWRLPS